MDDAELLKAIDKLKSTMISVATGGPRIAEVQDEFSALFDAVDAELGRRSIPNALPYRELWDWYGRWSSGDLPSYKSRRTFVNELAGDLVRAIKAGPQPSAPSPSPVDQPVGETTGWDVFISHASEDKASFARPLVERLRHLGVKVWFDEATLKLGDSLRRSIDNGLAHARFGVVVISPHFLRKEWPQKELDGLVAREIDGVKVILPILHDITPAEVRKVSPMLADRLAAMSSDGVDAVADQILQVVRPDQQTSLVAAQSASTPAPAPALAGDLILIGPEIIAVGGIDRIGPKHWRLHLRDFVAGDIGGLIRYAEGFDALSVHDRFVVLDGLGDGRVLVAPPEFERDGDAYKVVLTVAPSAVRMTAQSMPSTLATSPETGDLYLDRGNIARVLGVSSIPQRFRETLSHMRGESPSHLDFGSRLQEYYWRFQGSPWLGAVLKAEVIRLAAIPYVDLIQKTTSTPLHCVERVWGVEAADGPPAHNRLAFALDVEIKGLGRQTREVSVLMPPAPDVRMAMAKGKAYVERLSQPPLQFPDLAHQTDSARGAMFWGEQGRNRVRCIVSREALDDHFSDDGRLSPDAAFLANRAAIQNLALEKYRSGQIEPDGSIIIRTADIA